MHGYDCPRLKVVLNAQSVSITTGILQDGYRIIAKSADVRMAMLVAAVPAVVVVMTGAGTIT
jgi:hypothetical protein